MSGKSFRPRAPRHEIRLSAELRVEGKTVTGVTRNLSPGGVCLEIDRPIVEGAPVRLMLFVVEDDIEAEGARGLELTGTVQWAAESERGHAIGVKFASLTTAQSNALTGALRAIGQPTA
jgi:hypothetical protein